MKKSLSLLVAIAMVFSMFASVAAAATTASDAGAKLQELKVIKGDQSGDLMEDATWKRQDLAVLLSRLLGKEAEAEKAAKAHTYADVPAGYYDGFLSWALENKFMEGNSATSFGFGDTLTNQQFYAVVLRALGVDTTGDNYAKTLELAVAAGIVAEGVDAKAEAKRGDTYVAIVTALDTEVAGKGQKLGTILGLKGYEVTELAVASVKQSGAKKLTVEFNRALTTEEESALKVDVKNELTPYAVTKKVAEDKKSVVLEATFLPAAEYTVTVNEFEAVKVAVVDEKVTKIDINTATVQISASQKFDVKVSNQFNEEMDKGTLSLTTTVYGKGAALTANGTLDYDTSGLAKDDVVVVTVSHPGTGVTATKTYKATDASTVTALALGTVVPLKDKTRISTGDDDLVLPYTFTDANGNTFKLSATDVRSNTANSAKIGDFEFIVSNSDIVDPTTFAVGSDGALTFDVDDAGTVVITVLNAKAGASATTTVKVEDSQKVKKFQVSHPGVLVAKAEAIKVPFAAVDNFGAPIDNKEFSKTATNSQVSFTTNRGSDLTITPSFNYKGELSLTIADATATKITGNTIVFAWVEGTIASQFTVDLKEVAVPTKVLSLKDLATNYGIGGSDKVELSSVKVVDNYGREVTNLGTVALIANEKTPADNQVTLNATFDTITGAVAGSTKLVIGLDADGDDAVDAGTSIEVDVNVIANDKISSFEVESPGKLYGKDSNTNGNGHQKALTLIGKTSDGKKIAIVQSTYFTAVTSSDTSVIAVDGATAWALKKGEATISFLKGASTLASITVSADDATPVATTLKVDNAEVTVADGANLVTAAGVSVKDQYGDAIAPVMYWSSSNEDVLTVNSAGVVDLVAAGTAEVTVVTANGLIKTITVTIA